jgi:hypothetical protein
MKTYIIGKCNHLYYKRVFEGDKHKENAKIEFDSLITDRPGIDLTMKVVEDDVHVSIEDIYPEYMAGRSYLCSNSDGLIEGIDTPIDMVIAPNLARTDTPREPLPHIAKIHASDVINNFRSDMAKEDHDFITSSRVFTNDVFDNPEVITPLSKVKIADLDTEEDKDVLYDREEDNKDNNVW